MALKGLFFDIRGNFPHQGRRGTSKKS